MAEPERGIGGYANSIALTGAGPSIREVTILANPSAATALSCAEQTFTLPGLLAVERVAYVTQISPSSAATIVSTTSNISMNNWHTQAISVMGVAFCTAGTSAGTITTGTSIGVTWAVGIAQARGL